MIYVNCPSSQDQVRKILEEAQEDITFKFVEKNGIKMTFEVNTEDLDAAVDKAKALIRATEIGRILYFQVTK